MPTCITEVIFISSLRVTFSTKHYFTVTKRTHAIKLLCKNDVKTFNSEDFFLISETFFRNFEIALDSEIFFSILKVFARFLSFFLDCGYRPP